MIEFIGLDVRISLATKESPHDPGQLFVSSHSIKIKIFYFRMASFSKEAPSECLSNTPKEPPRYTARSSRHVKEPKNYLEAQLTNSLSSTNMLWFI